MAELSRGDLRHALGVVEMVMDGCDEHPFSLPVLGRLQELLDADSAGGYVESTSHAPGGGYELVTRATPSWLFPVLADVGEQDPIHAAHCRGLSTPVAISDRLSAREFQQLDIYRLVCEPLRTADSLRLYLPAPSGTARFFFFDRSSGRFLSRDHKFLDLLRPHLTHARATHAGPRGRLLMPALTTRETVVLRLVARGASNAQIAAELCVSGHTVRKHLENVFAKLGVHSRTAAAAFLHQQR